VGNGDVIRICGLKRSKVVEKLRKMYRKRQKKYRNCQKMCEKMLKFMVGNANYPPKADKPAKRMARSSLRSEVQVA
jgi:hypothetical protein